MEILSKEFASFPSFLALLFPLKVLFECIWKWDRTQSCVSLLYCPSSMMRIVRLSVCQLGCKRQGVRKVTSWSGTASYVLSNSIFIRKSEKNGQGPLLRQIMILHRKWLIEKSKKISYWQNQFRGMWCSWKCKIHLHFPYLKLSRSQIFLYNALSNP